MITTRNVSIDDICHTTLIPKIVHYCWFGDMVMPQTIVRCLNSWREHLPEYQFVLWRNQHIPRDLTYAQNAFRLKNWSNLSNFFRLAAVYQFGGVYLDTDILLVKPLDSLLTNGCFLGCQDRSPVSWMVNTAVIGAVPRHWFVGDLLGSLLEDFNGDENSSLSGVNLVSRKLQRLGIKKYNKSIIQIDDITIYPVRYFYPISYREKHKLLNPESSLTQDTIAIHFWMNSWVSSDTPIVPKWSFFNIQLAKIRRLLVKSLKALKINGLLSQISEKALIAKLKRVDRVTTYLKNNISLDN